jgi:hypothetical protein
VIKTMTRAELQELNPAAGAAAVPWGMHAFTIHNGQLFGCEAFDDTRQEAHPWWYVWNDNQWIEAP